ncbi:MAG: HAD family hydrolase [Proteobacteria bacterium]|nr:HAD family hydrolase [Pseudomonadota bacterium]
MAVVRIAMWSGPRNISTALMRSFENRPDCSVVDEPLYGYYLRRTGLAHPVGDEIIHSMDCDWRSVVRDLCHREPEPCQVYYQKHMTHHLLPEVELGFSDSLRNCFLIREPRRIIASYLRVRPDFTLEELGFPQQWQLFQRVADKLGGPPPVIDSAQVLRAPEKNLRALCEAVGIKFSAKMLQWPAGPRASDGIWASHWYESVNRSTRFQPVERKPLSEVKIPQRYEALCEEADRIYENLYRHALIRA